MMTGPSPDHVPLELPTLTEAAAVMAAVVAFNEALEPRISPMVTDMPRLLEELEAAIRRVRAVTR